MSYYNNQANSYFDGGLIGLIGINILTIILTVITFGIAYPWVICMKLGWTTKHTVINGNRLRFMGTGIGLFGTWIKWIFLTIITLGIYSFWLVIKMKEWEVKNTVFE